MIHPKKQGTVAHSQGKKHTTEFVSELAQIETSKLLLILINTFKKEKKPVFK